MRKCRTRYAFAKLSDLNRAMRKLVSVPNELREKASKRKKKMWGKSTAPRYPFDEQPAVRQVHHCASKGTTMQ